MTCHQRRLKKKSRSVTRPRMTAEPWSRKESKSLLRGCNSTRHSWDTSARPLSGTQDLMPHQHTTADAQRAVSYSVTCSRKFDTLSFFSKSNFRATKELQFRTWNFNLHCFCFKEKNNPKFEKFCSLARKPKKKHRGPSTVFPSRKESQVLS